MTPAEATRELYRQDYTAFCEQQCTILPKTGVPTKLYLNPLQEQIDVVAEKQWSEHGYIRVVVFKARQRGGTTYSVSRGCWRVYFNSNTSGIIISCDDDSTANAFNKCQLIYEELHPAIRPMRRYNTKTSIVLENPDKKKSPGNPGLRSRMECATAKNMNAGVSTTRQVLCMSEMPRWSRTEEIRSSLLPTMPLDAPGTIVINEATPFGWGKGRDEFRSWCDAARSGKDVYKLVELYWWMDPECRIARAKNERLRYNAEERYWMKKCHLDDEQILFRRRMIMELGKMDEGIGEMLFLQEFPGDYESAWSSTETPAFDRRKLEALTRDTIIPPIRRATFELIKRTNSVDAIFHDDSLGAFWIWEEPKSGEIYDIGADCAPPGEGKDPDRCAFSVIKRSNKEQVAEWEGRPGVFDFSAILDAVGYFYNEAHIGVEVNQIGYAVNEGLCLRLYPNIYNWRLRQHAMPKLSPLTGWKTQTDTKPLMIAVADDLLVHDRLLIHSSRLREQMRRYIHYYSDAGNDKWEAGEGHDDILDSWMIAQVISKDEDARGGTPYIGPTYIASLAERNAAIVEFMQNHQPGMSDVGAQMAFGPPVKNSPWDKLARSFGLNSTED